jgi:hypothetical protein
MSAIRSYKPTEYWMKWASASVGALLAACCIALGGGAISSARAGGTEGISCYAAPYGQSGDRCNAANPQYLGVVHLRSVEHSGCADAINNSGALVQSWLCTAGPNGELNVNFGFNQPLRGILRNNTTGDWTHLTGSQTW